MYRRCAESFHWSARDVDLLEVWEVGAALGVNTDDVETYYRETNRPAGTGGAVQSPARDLVAERIAHSRGEGPAVEPDVMLSHQVFALQEAIRVG
jgi:hypothetical protein